jgi:sugar lactone lactonase YvrE
VAFGGADMRLMFVTSAKEGLSPEDLARDRLAGSLLVYQTEVAGLLDRRYAAPA